jgi:phage portal protein BeeE
MFNPWPFGELKRLRAENDLLKKAVSPETLLAGGPVGMLSESPQLGVSRELERHFAVGWVYAACRPICQRIASQPVRVARRTSRPNPSKMVNKSLAPSFVKDMREGLELLDDHEIISAIDNPNDYMTRWTLLYNTVASLQITGRAFWLHAEDGIWPLPASWVEPKHENGHLFSSFIVRPRFTGTALQTEYDGSLISRFYLPDPSNPLRGSLSPLQAAARAVSTDESIQECQQRIFQNGIFPGLAVVVGRNPDISGIKGQRPMLTREQRQQIITAISQQYRGALNYGNPLILDALIEDVKKLSNSPAEMDFSESCQLTKSRIFQSFGVNPVVAGEITGVNRAQAAIADSLFCSGTINPLAELISEWMTKELPPRYDDPDVVCWIEPARPRDEEATRADMEQLAKYGCVTRNELRSIYNFPKLETPDGDELIPMARSGQPTAGAEGELAGGKFFLDDESDPASALLEPMGSRPRIGGDDLHGGARRLLPSPGKNGSG